MKEVGGTASIFVKSGADYVRVATNVKKDDGSRAIGTILDPKGKVIEFINMDEAFYGAATILGKPYLTGYEPMRDARNNVNRHLLFWLYGKRFFDRTLTSRVAPRTNPSIRGAVARGHGTVGTRRSLSPSQHLRTRRAYMVLGRFNVERCQLIAFSEPEASYLRMP